MLGHMVSPRGAAAVKHVCGRPSSVVAQAQARQPGNWDSTQEGAYSVSVLGDLHLEPAQMHLFHEARQQLVAVMEPGAPRVVQLGDLGGYKHRPGGCIIHNLKRLALMMLGNHSLCVVQVDLGLSIDLDAVVSVLAGLAAAIHLAAVLLLCVLQHCRLPGLLQGGVRVPGQLWRACGAHHRQSWYAQAAPDICGSVRGGEGGVLHVDRSTHRFMRLPLIADAGPHTA